MTETHETSSLPRPPRRSWRPLVFGLILLTSGAAIGAGSAVFFVERQIVSAQNETPEHASARASRNMRSRLDLTPEQSEEVKKIFRAHHESTKAIHEEMRPRMEAELEKLRDDVYAVLTPEQGKQWGKKWERLRKRWMHGGRGRMDRRRGGADGPPPRMRPNDGRPPRSMGERPRFDGPPPENPPPPPR